MENIDTELFSQFAGYDAPAAARLSGYGDDRNPYFFFFLLFLHNLPTIHLFFDKPLYGFHRPSFFSEIKVKAFGLEEPFKHR